MPTHYLGPLCENSDAPLFYTFTHNQLTLVSSSYVIIGEVSSQRVKEKTNDLAVSVSVITTFIVSFTLPYLLNAPYAALGAKVGFIYGSFAMVAVIVAYFMIPEMKGRTLEEIDQLFASGVSMRKFTQFKTVRVGDESTKETIQITREENLN